MYKDIINWIELDYLLMKLNSKELKSNALSQRIYRTKDKSKILTLKLALLIYNLESNLDED